MKAVQLSRFGGPDALEIVEVPTPALGPGEVLIRVRAAGINFFEALMRQDRYAVTPDLPMIFGVEVAGTVEAHGEDVTSPPLGARVAVPMFAAGRGSGGYAEYVAIDAGSVAPLPDGLSFDEAAALMIQGLTALQLVRRSPPKNKTVLVAAAAGGVGSLLTQLAKRAGAALVIAAASTQEKRAFALSLGADVAVDESDPAWLDRIREATDGAGVDILYDNVGGPTTKSRLEALAPCGDLVFGALGRFDLGTAQMEAMFNKNQSLKGFALLPLLTPAGLQADLADLFHQAANGELAVTLGGRYPLAQASEAHRALESRATMGKLVLVP